MLFSLKGMGATARGTDMSSADRFLMAGVMGWPVMHSRSPKLHNYWLASTARRHLCAACHKAERSGQRCAPCRARLCRLQSDIPHKETALDIVDRVDARARRIGAISCVIVAPTEPRRHQQRRFRLHRRAARGRAALARRCRPGRGVGAGGAARAILDGLVEEGAREIRLLNRTSTGARLARDFGGPVRPIAGGARRPLDGAATLVNTTEPGHGRPAGARSPLDALPRPRSSPTSSIFRARRRSSLQRGSAATARSTGSACCCTRRARPSIPGSASCRR